MRNALKEQPEWDDEWACRPYGRYENQETSKWPSLYRDGRIAPREPNVYSRFDQYSIRSRLIDVQQRICALCGEELDSDDHRSTVNHVIPRSLHGSDDLGNLVAAHNRCNNRKSNDIPTGCEMVWLLAVNARLGVKPDIF